MIGTFHNVDFSDKNVLLVWLEGGKHLEKIVEELKKVNDKIGSLQLEQIDRLKLGKHSLEVSLIYINRVGLAFVVYSLLVTKEFALRVDVYVASTVYNLGVGSTDVPQPLFWVEKKFSCDQTNIQHVSTTPTFQNGCQVYIFTF